MTTENKEKEDIKNDIKKEDKKKREFLLNKEISAESVESIILGILEVNKFDEEKEKDDSNYKREPIKLIVDSYGGSIYCGNTLISIIDTSKTPVHTYCYGKAMSQGLMIYASGHKRFAHPLACFMYHDGGSVYKGTTEEIQLSVEQLRKLTKMCDKYLVETTNLTQEKLDEVKNARLNWYFFAEEALEYGVVDELLNSTRGDV